MQRDSSTCGILYPKSSLARPMKAKPPEPERAVSIPSQISALHCSDEGKSAPAEICLLFHFHISSINPNLKLSIYGVL